MNLGPTPTVSYTTRENFRTKTGKSRTIPLERGLAQKLTAWRVKNPTARLVFPADEGKVEGHFLRICKAVALRSGQDPSNFWLHKFRDTFGTWALRRGVDIRTVQHWLGHASIEMTQRYLAPHPHNRDAIRPAIISPCADAPSLAFFSVSALPPPHLRKGRIRAVSKSTKAAGWRGMPRVPAFRP